MGWFIGSIVFICFIAIILLLSQIYFTIDFKINEREHQFIIAVYLFKIRLMKKVNPSLPETPKNMLDEYEFDMSVDQFFQDMKDLLKRMKQFHQLSLELLQRLTFHRLDWYTDIGTGEASSTGMTIGGLWGVKGLCMSYLSEHSRLKCQPQTHILPHFQQKLMSTKFNCIVSIRIGQAIYAFIKTLWTIQKSSK